METTTYITSYLRPGFLQHIDGDGVKVIFDVGARDLIDSIRLCRHYRKSLVYSYECNPETIPLCAENLRSSDVRERIIFRGYALGEHAESLEFYPYKSSPGPSSFLKRIDFHHTQSTHPARIRCSTLYEEMRRLDIAQIDLLCMDVQGFELNVLKGGGERIADIRYVIMEEPNPVPDPRFLPPGCHSKYIGAPTSKELKDFMYRNNFIEIQRIPENHIEDNVLYANQRFSRSSFPDASSLIETPLR